jgi:hypothetical protein
MNNQHPSKIIINQDKTSNSLNVGKEITLGSISRGLGNGFKILVGGAFPSACKRKSKGGVVAATTNGDTLEEPIIYVNRNLMPLLHI